MGLNKFSYQKKCGQKREEIEIRRLLMVRKYVQMIFISVSCLEGFVCYHFLS